MKKICLTMVSSLLIMIAVSLSALAAPAGYKPERYTSVNESSDLLDKQVLSSIGYGIGERRGNFLSGADLIITNKGGGKIRALAIGHTDTAVDEAYITVYLDRWNASSSKWVQVTSYSKEYTSKNYPDGVEDPTMDIVFTNQKKGYYYRLRGVFAAYLDGKHEGFSATTDGVMVD